MTGRGDPPFGVPDILTRLRRSLVPAIAIGVLVAVGGAILFAVMPNRFRGSMVLVPVQGSRVPPNLSGVASSILGAGVDLPAGGFTATRDVVSYLLLSRTVLLAASAVPHNGAPVSAGVVGRGPDAGNEEDFLRELRRRVRTTVSRETDFVTVTLQARDSGAVRVLLGAIVDETQRVFAGVAQSQARQLRRAMELRVDSAEAELRRAEEALVGFDERNRMVAPRSRLALERARLEREVADASRVWESVTAERQSAQARELETAPALAVVEQLPATIVAPPRRVLFRGALAGVLAALAVFLVLAVRDLARAAARDMAA
jgi:hypothetical protein